MGTVYYNNNTVKEDLKNNFFSSKHISRPTLQFTASTDSRPAWMLKQEEEKQLTRIWRIKCFIIFLTLFVITAAVVAPILYCFYSCKCQIFEGQCSKYCKTCEYDEGDWKKIADKNTYVVNRRMCGNKVYITLDGQDIKVSDSSVSGSEGKQSNSSLYLTQYKNLTLKMNLNNFSKNNESITIELWDNGTEFLGLGDFQEAAVKSKSGKSYSYTLWTTEAEPTYLPFYITKNKVGAICVVLDAGGSPVKVSVNGDSVKWKVYTNNFNFHVSNASNVVDAMSGCLTYWKSKYDYTLTTWSQKVILGSDNITTIKEARATSNVLATDYYLMQFNITDEQFLHNGTVSNWDDIMLRLEPTINITDGQSLKDEYKMLLEAAGGRYYLDFGGIDSTSKVWINKVLKSQDVNGFFLADGHLPGRVENSTWTCKEKYLKCDTLDYDDDSTFCTSAKFGAAGSHFQSHNIYNRERAEYIKGQLPKVLLIQSSAAPGTVNFYRENLPATWSGMKKCYYEMVNMHLGGVYGYSCNVCGGVLVRSGTVCDRWSQLNIIMPYTIMTNQTVFPLLIDFVEPGRYIKNNLRIRDKLRHYLASSYEDSISNNKSFIALTSLYYNLETEQDTLMIGDGLFYAPILTETAAKTFNLPPKHKWISLSSFIRHSAGEEVAIKESQTSALNDLLYIKSGVVMLFSNVSNGNLIDVNVFPDENDEVDDDYIFHYGDASRSIGIKLSSSDDKIHFSPELNSSYYENTKVQSLVVHYWYKKYSCSTSRVSYEQQGNGWKITYDYSNDLQDFFRNDTWSIDLSSAC